MVLWVDGTGGIEIAIIGSFKGEYVKRNAVLTIC